jgi:hypothetical protein
MRRPGIPPIEALFEPSPPVVAEVISRAASSGYEDWWARVTDSGFCAAPVHLAGRGKDDKRVEVLGRCKNRRASVCPSCSQLYSGDTWQLVQAGLLGAGVETDATIARHPMVFATLTAPSFGPVHRVDRHAMHGNPGACHPGKRARRCIHGRSLVCRLVHDPADERVGQPLCPDCYDYSGHVLFNWHAPELWHRFSVLLRRLVARSYREAGGDPKAGRVSYVKIIEMQRRGLVHVHTVIRLDGPGDGDTGGHQAPPEGTLDASQLAGLVRRAAATSRLHVASSLVPVRFGDQLDVQPLVAAATTSEGMSASAITGRRVAAYLAKYVTKSVADFGLNARRLHEGVIDDLDVSDHVRRILWTIVELSRQPGRERMSSLLHALGYRGHITTKTRHYSTTMGELRARRDAWRRSRGQVDQDDSTDNADGREASGPTEWRYMGCGHANDGERLLAISAAGHAREVRRTAREELAAESAAEWPAA